MRFEYWISCFFNCSKLRNKYFMSQRIFLYYVLRNLFSQFCSWRKLIFNIQCSKFITCKAAGRWKTLGGPVVMVGIICPPPVWIGLTDLPNIGGPLAPLAPPVPAPLTCTPKLTDEMSKTLIKYIHTLELQSEGIENGKALGIFYNNKYLSLSHSLQWKNSFN